MAKENWKDIIRQNLKDIDTTTEKTEELTEKTEELAKKSRIVSIFATMHPAGCGLN